MTEKNGEEQKFDFLKAFQEITKAIPIYTDLAITGFVIFRNIKSGANTITRSGLTSFGDGLLQEWPRFGPNGNAIGQGNKEGTTDFGANKVYTTQQQNAGNVSESTNNMGDLTKP